MRLVWVVIPLILIGIVLVTLVGVKEADATICYGAGHPWSEKSSGGAVFLGTVTSIENKMLDEPIHNDLDNGLPSVSYGSVFMTFEVHNMLKGVPFDTIVYSANIASMNPPTTNIVGKQYLIFGYQGGNVVYHDDCGGGVSMEINNLYKINNTSDPVELLSELYDGNYISFSNHHDTIGGILGGIEMENQRQLKLEEQRAQSPDTQLRNNIFYKDILCKEGLHLFFKNNYDSSPVCITPSTITKLIERGWGYEKFIDKKPNNIIQINDSKNYLKYRITDNSKVTEVIYNEKHRSLVLKIDTMVQGKLVIELPRHVIDAKKIHGGDDSEFIILIKGDQMEYNEISSTVDTRTLIIPFEHEITQIEIIGVTAL